MSPGLTLLEAVLNSSLVLVEYAVYLFCIQDIPIMTMAISTEWTESSTRQLTKGEKEAHANDDPIASALG